TISSATCRSSAPRVRRRSPRSRRCSTSSTARRLLWRYSRKRRIAHGETRKPLSRTATHRRRTGSRRAGGHARSERKPVGRRARGERHRADDGPGAGEAAQVLPSAPGETLGAKTEEPEMNNEPTKTFAHLGRLLVT